MVPEAKAKVLRKTNHYTKSSALGRTTQK